MAFHIPFNQRHQLHGPQPRTVYIGFDRSRRPKKKFNWWAFGGFMTTFFTLGILAPIGLLMSLVGLRRTPRSLAKFSTAISLIGTLFWGLIFGTAYYSHQHDVQVRSERYNQRMVAVQIGEAEVLIKDAHQELEQFQENNEGMLPSEIDCNMLMLKHVDPWNKELRFEARESSFGVIRSAGPDGSFFTGDDLTKKIEGETEREVLLPLD